MATNLDQLFKSSEAQFSSTSSLRYQAPIQASVSKPITRPKNNSPVFASVVILYRYGSNSNAIDLGKKGCAIVPNKEENNNSYCLICYEVKNRQLLFSIMIVANFSVSIQKNHFISFYDAKSNYFSMRLPNEQVLEQMVSAITMCKRPNLISFNKDNGIITQSLNNVSGSNQGAVAASIIGTSLKIWLCDFEKHPYERGRAVFNSEKIINLHSDKILPALSMTLKSTKLNEKIMILTSSKFGFGEKGNKTLQIPMNCPLIMEVTVNSIKDGDNEIDDNVSIASSNAPPPAQEQAQAPPVQIVQKIASQNSQLTDHDHHDQTKERMKKLSAASGGSLLATLVGGASKQTQNALSSNASITSDRGAMMTEGINSPIQAPVSYFQSQPQPQPQPTPQALPQVHIQRQQQPHQQTHQPLIYAPAMSIAPQQQRSQFSHGYEQHPQVSVADIQSTLKQILMELHDLSNPKSTNFSARDIIKSLSNLSETAEDDKKQIESQKLEIKTLEERLSKIKSRNHELLEKNNALMEQQYKSMSSSHDESLKVKQENILLQQRNDAMSKELEGLRTENDSFKEKVNDLLTNLNEKQLSLTQVTVENEGFVKERDALENELNALKESKLKIEEENDGIAIEKNQIIKALKEEKSESDKKIIDVTKDLDDIKEKLQTVQEELAESKTESNEILTLSKKKIEKMKKQFEAHRLDLIKRILEFVYVKYSEQMKAKQNEESEFNYISFFRSITKGILANPDDFDEDEESVSSDNAEEND